MAGATYDFTLECFDKPSGKHCEYRLSASASLTGGQLVVDLHDLSTGRCLFSRADVPGLRLEHLGIGGVVMIDSRELRVTKYNDGRTRAAVEHVTAPSLYTQFKHCVVRIRGARGSLACSSATGSAATKSNRAPAKRLDAAALSIWMSFLGLGFVLMGEYHCAVLVAILAFVIGMMCSQARESWKAEAGMEKQGRENTQTRAEAGNSSRPGSRGLMVGACLCRHI